MNWPTPQEWAAKLRSPDAPKQTQGQLCNGDARCCLAVLAEMTGAKQFESESFMIWPNETIKWHSNSLYRLPDWMTHGDHDHAAELNDRYNKTFDEIADWIDERWG